MPYRVFVGCLNILVHPMYAFVTGEGHFPRPWNRDGRASVLEPEAQVPGGGAYSSCR